MGSTVSGYNLPQTPPFPRCQHQGHQVLHSAWNGFSQKNHRFFFQLMDRGNCFLHYTLTRLLYILGTLHMYTLSTFNIVRISSIYVDYWVYLLTYFELTLSILCILDSVKTLLSRGTYGEESNQLHHPGGSICSAVQTSQRSSLWRIE